MNTWDLFFSWPAGGVWSNLIASAITTTLAGTLVVWRFLKKLRLEHEQHRQLIQQQLDDHHERILQAVGGDGLGTESNPGG